MEYLSQKKGFLGYDANQKMYCKFKDVNSSKEVEAEILVKGTSKKEIETSKDELEMFILE